jgi:hypothetical protein
MSELEDIRDDQIRVIGSDVRKKPLLHRRLVRVSLLLLTLAVIVLWALLWGGHGRENSLDEPAAAVGEIEPALFEPVEVSVELEEDVQKIALGNRADSIDSGYIEFKDTLINDIPLRLFIPHNAEMSLHIGKMDYSDTTVVYAAQAADVRADNGGIVGAFVLKGEPLAWGLSKKGYCASINGVVSVGVADNSPLFEQATEQGGYFFRQYPLVSDGVIVENEPKGKSIRRGICDRRGEIFMVETGSAESFHDFSQALVDLGVDQAVYLVGSSAYGWAVNESGDVYEFGDRNYYGGRRKQPKNTSYIVWRRR